MTGIRPARLADAPQICAVLVASIRELCVADHRNDPEALAGWLANKTPEAVAQRIARPTNTLLVAERDGEIAGVGGLNTDRMITLNYVAPAHRFRGVSAALLAALEAALGPGEARLDATRTALDFYLARGWQPRGAPSAYKGVTGYPLRKLL